MPAKPSRRESRLRNRASVSGRLRADMLRVDAVALQDTLGPVVPDVHARDLASANDEAVDVRVAVEGGAVGPFAVERADRVDDGLVRARHDVEAIHSLFHPAVAFG